MASAILSRMFEMDPLRALASVETISTGAIEWLVDWDETQASWEEETKTVDADTPTAKLGKKRIAVFPLAARPAATQILLEDASINIESWLSAKAADKFSRVEAPAFVTGNGVGKPRGFLTYPNYSSSGVDQYGAIERVNMGNASAITADGFSRIKYSLIEQFLTRGTWLMNRLTVAEVTRLKDGQGQYLWTPGLRDDATSTILGLPVRMATSMPVVGAGAYSVALADWKAAYMIVDRIGITLQRDPYTRKPFIEFYFRKRVGGDVINFQAIKLGVISA
jgi:HK97 family phage major capsid protein